MLQTSCFSTWVHCISCTLSQQEWSVGNLRCLFDCCRIGFVRTEFPGSNNKNTKNHRKRNNDQPPKRRNTWARWNKKEQEVVGATPRKKSRRTTGRRTAAIGALVVVVVAVVVFSCFFFIVCCWMLLILYAFCTHCKALDGAEEYHALLSSMARAGFSHEGFPRSSSSEMPTLRPQNDAPWQKVVVHFSAFKTILTYSNTYDFILFSWHLLSTCQTMLNFERD